MTSINQRAELQAKIWKIANDVRGSVDGWDFKQFVLGTLFYRFISENFTNYIEGGDDGIHYANLPDEVITPQIKEDAIKTKGYFIYPSQLYINVVKNAHANPNLNTDLKAIFDAPALNTLFVDKNLRYHGLMQAFSRTNRIYDATKTFGNIITFRDLEKATIDAITLFGDSSTKNVVLEKSYKEYLEGFTDIATGEARRGYTEVVKELKAKFPDPEAIVTEKDKKDFSKLFGEYLRIENILQNYDEFTQLKAIQSIDRNDPEAVEAFKEAYFVTDEEIGAMQEVEILPDRTIQDYRSTYNDIRDWLRREKSGKEADESTIDWEDVVFEIDLLKSQEINLDYILELIFEHNKKNKDKASLIEEIRRVIRASIGNRAKEGLVVDFMNETDLDAIRDKANIIDAFFEYAQHKQKTEVAELIKEEDLNEEEAKRYITISLKREFASENGTDLNAILPKMSPLNPLYLTKKQRVFKKVALFIEKFKGVGGQL